MNTKSYNDILIRTRTVSCETCPQENRTCKDDYYSLTLVLEHRLRIIVVVLLSLADEHSQHLQNLLLKERETLSH